jgi:predicted DsbA family dithiol-disulfide isomerase
MTAGTDVPDRPDADMKDAGRFRAIGSVFRTRFRLIDVAHVGMAALAGRVRAGAPGAAMLAVVARTTVPSWSASRGTPSVHVEIWSDIACPWCHVGKRRFDAALASFEHRDDVEVTWRSFELDPSAPRERDVDGAGHLAQKYGTSRDEALAMQRRMTDVAAAEGLDFRFDLARGGSTFDAHRLLHLAAAHDVQDALMARLMRAYLGEGELIGDPAVLERLALEVGLRAEEVRDVLGSDRFGAAVREDERAAATLGIHAVPFFVVDRRLGAAGAQPPEALLDLLRRAWPREPAVEVVADGASCGVEGC